MNRKEKEACGRAWKRYRNSGKPEVDWAAEQHAFFAGWAAASGVIRRRIEKMTK